MEIMLISYYLNKEKEHDNEQQECGYGTSYENKSKYFENAFNRRRCNVALTSPANFIILNKKISNIQIFFNYIPIIKLGNRLTYLQ